MLPKLIDAAAAMDTIFWRQYYPARDSLLGALSDSALRRLVIINAGPWDRLDDDKPFVPGAGPRPPGVEFYPHDMTKEEFEKAAAGQAPELALRESLHGGAPGFRGQTDGGALPRGAMPTRSSSRPGSCARLPPMPRIPAFGDFSSSVRARSRPTTTRPATSRGST